MDEDKPDQRNYRQGRSQAVDTIENTAMARQDVAAVLDSGLAFEQGLVEVANDADDCRADQRQNPHSPRHKIEAKYLANDHTINHHTNAGSDGAFASFTRADRRCQFVLAESLAGKIRRDVVHGNPGEET